MGGAGPWRRVPGHRRLGSGPGRATGSARQAGWWRAPQGPLRIRFPVASAPRHAHCPLCRPLPSVSPPLGQSARGRQRPCRTQPLPRAALCVLGTQRGAAKGALTVTGPCFQTPPSPLPALRGAVCQQMPKPFGGTDLRSASDPDSNAPSSPLEGESCLQAQNQGLVPEQQLQPPRPRETLQL